MQTMLSRKQQRTSRQLLRLQAKRDQAQAAFLAVCAEEGEKRARGHIVLGYSPAWRTAFASYRAACWNLVIMTEQGNAEEVFSQFGHIVKAVNTPVSKPRTLELWREEQAL